MTASSTGEGRMDDLAFDKFVGELQQMMMEQGQDPGVLEIDPAGQWIRLPLKDGEWLKVHRQHIAGMRQSPAAVYAEYRKQRASHGADA
jgi:hypothetical protein